MAEDPVDLDALLRQELAVAPSADLLPRVRERIREQPVRTPRRWWWLALPVPVAATLVFALQVPDPPRLPSAPAAPMAAARPEPAARYSAPATEHRLPHTAYRAPRTEHRVPDTGAPIVMVDQRQRAALALFVALIERGQMTTETFANTTAAPEVIEDTVTGITIEWVAVSPIAPGGVLPHETERK